VSNWGGGGGFFLNTQFISNCLHLQFFMYIKKIIILILGEARHMTMPQNWHANAKGNEGKENEKRIRLHVVYIFNSFY